MPQLIDGCLKTVTKGSQMKISEANILLSKLEDQLQRGFKRIEQLESLGLLGFEHSALREQINAMIMTLDWLQETLPHPFLPSHFIEYTKLKNEWKPKFSWVGWL